MDAQDIVQALQANMMPIAICLVGGVIVLKVIKGAVKWALLIGVAALIAHFCGVF